MNKKARFYLPLSICVVFSVSLGLEKMTEDTARLAASSFAPVLVIEGANIWDGAGGEPIRDGVIVVSGGNIQAVGPRASTPIPKGATVISGAGKTLIPGLINAHGHVGMTKGLKAGPENYSEENVVAQLRQYA